jgi:predicted metal-dependent peptidase
MNVAMDCVVNDSLLYWYKFPKVFDEKSEIKLCYGMDILKTNCHDMTAEEVYYMLPEDMFKDFDCMHMSWDSFFDENGNLKKEFADKIKGFISNNKMNSNLSDEEMAEIERMKEKFKECKDQNAGNIPIGNLRSVADVNKYLKWDQILSEFVEIRKIEETWARVDKKLYSFYPDTILPSSKDAEKQEIFVAIDASGSIDYNALSLFTSLLKSIPDHIKITAISFDTQCYEYDIFGNERPKGSGGTSFNIIEDHLQKNLKKYPKCVIVMTDGKGNDINPQYKNRWLWLLYGSSSNAYCKDMKHYELERFIK